MDCFFSPSLATAAGGGCGSLLSNSWRRRRTKSIAICSPEFFELHAFRRASFNFNHAQVTCPILVADRVKGRERKWTKAALVSLRSAFGVLSIDFASNCSFT